MVFTLEEQDPARYRRKARIISVVMVGQLIIFGMLFSLLLSEAMGPSFWSHALGIVLGLLATSALFAVLKERPWMAEMRYVWQLKGHLSQINRYHAALDLAINEDNRAALDILSFYHQGLDQLARLNGRESDGQRLTQKERVHARREALDLPASVTRFDTQDLSAFKRG